MSFIHKLRQEVRADIFTSNDLKALLHPMTDAAIHNGVSRSIQAKDIVQLKRGLYLFSKPLRKGSISTFLIANKMYAPSYVSFESALSYHGLIPEGVYTVTSACFQRKSKCFHSELGDFVYEYIPCADFFLGVTYDKSKDGALIASAIRALFDLIYLRKLRYSSLNELEEDLRIELSLLKHEVQKCRLVEMEELAKLYKKKNVMDFHMLLMKEFK
jgi:hypothetical protein